MNKKIEMQFPNKDDKYLDGKIHQIVPLEMYKLNINEEEAYFLVYRDLTFSYDCCTTIVSRKGNTFYKRPLDRYDENLYELIETSTPVDTAILGSKIELGSDLSIDTLISSISNNTIEIVANDSVSIPTDVSSAGPVPPSFDNNNGSLLPPNAEKDDGKFLLPPKADDKDGKNNNNSYVESRDIYSKVFGVVSKSGIRFRIDYFTYDDKNSVTAQFSGEPEGTFLYYKNIHRAATIYVDDKNEIFNATVKLPLGENRGTSVSGDTVTRRDNSILNVTEILINYTLQGEISDEFGKTSNCLADSYFEIDKELYHWRGNNFTSNFTGFPKYIDQNYENNFFVACNNGGTKTR